MERRAIATSTRVATPSLTTGPRSSAPSSKAHSTTGSVADSATTTHSTSRTRKLAKTSLGASTSRARDSGKGVATGPPAATAIALASARSMNSMQPQVGYVGESGFDASIVGIVSTTIVGALTAFVLLYAFRRVSRLSTASRPRLCNPLELVAPRLFYAPVESRPPPLPASRLAWFFSRSSSQGPRLPNTPTFFPRYPNEDPGKLSVGTPRRWLSDAELLVRTSSVMTFLALGLCVVGLGATLPLVVAGVPSLSSSVYASSDTGVDRLQGGYSTLSDFTLLRLLHAYDLEKVGQLTITGVSAYHRLLIILVITIVFPPLFFLPILSSELKKVDRHIQECRNSQEGGNGCEIGFLRVDSKIWKERLAVGTWWNTVTGRRRERRDSGSRSQSSRSSGLHGLGEARLREVFSMCGLGPEKEKARAAGRAGAAVGLTIQPPSRVNEDGVQYVGLGANEEEGQLEKKEVCVEAVYSVPDLTALMDLENRRRKIVDALEESECLYMACFEPAGAAPAKAKKATGKGKTKKRAVKPSIMSFGPSGHYTLTQRDSVTTPLPLLPPTLSLRDSIGRHFTPASFLEVGLDNPDRLDDFELGEKLRINDEGRWSRAPPTPDFSKVRFLSQEIDRGDLESDSATEVLAPTPRALDYEDAGPASSTRRDLEEITELENTVAFPTASPPAPSSPNPRRRQYDPNTGFGVLATLSESEGETDDDDDDDDDDDEDDAHTARYQYADDRSPSAQTDVTGHFRSDTVGSSNAPSTSASTLMEAPTHRRWSTTGTSVDGNEAEREMTPNLDDLPSINGSDEGDVRRSDIPFPPPPPPPLPPSSAPFTLSAPPSQSSSRAPPRQIRSEISNLPSAENGRPLIARTSGSTRRKLTKQPSNERDEVDLVDPSTPRPHFQPRLRLASTATPDQLSSVYAQVRKHRAELRHINAEISELQTLSLSDIGDGKTARGFIVVGKRVSCISGVEEVLGRSRDDVRWNSLFQRESRAGVHRFWTLLTAWIFVFALLMVVPITLSVSNSPGVTTSWTFLNPYIKAGKLATGIVTSTVAALLVLLLTTLSSVAALRCAFGSSPLSVSQARLLALKGVILISGLLLPIGIILFGAVVSANWSIQNEEVISQTLADGVPQAFSLIFSFGIIAALSLPLWHALRPLEIWHANRQLLRAKTPRQRYFALQPSPGPPSYQFNVPVFALSAIGCTFPIAPLVVAPLLILMILITITNRHSSYYVISRTPETNGVYSATLLRYTPFFLVPPPILLALTLLSRRLFAFASASFAVAGVLLLAIATYFWAWTQRAPPLKATTLRALAAFDRGARDGSLTDEEGSRNASRTSLVGRRSIQSVFDLVNGISNDDSVPPSLPLDSEYIDPYDNPLQAAHLHGKAGPELPALSFDQSSQILRTLYPPILTRTRPVLILPDDPLARDEAKELDEYWHVKSVWQGSVRMEDLPGLAVMRRTEEPSEMREAP